MHSDFDMYYRNINKAKKINFCIHMCTALIQAKFSEKNVKLLDLSGTQAVVLLAFNDGEISVSSLQEITGLEDNELKKALISLSIPQQQILKIVDSDQAPKMTEGGETLPMSKKKSIKMNFTKNDKFMVNLSFSFFDFCFLKQCVVVSCELAINF